MRFMHIIWVKAFLHRLEHLGSIFDIWEDLVA